VSHTSTLKLPFPRVVKISTSVLPDQSFPQNSQDAAPPPSRFQAVMTPPRIKHKHPLVGCISRTLAIRYSSEACSVGQPPPIDCDVSHP
jgi:hypothetical protein